MTLPCLSDLRRLAATDPAAKMYLDIWERGHMTFEQAMIGLVLELAAQRDRYFGKVVVQLQKEVTPIVLDGVELRPFVAVKGTSVLMEE